MKVIQQPIIHFLLIGAILVGAQQLFQSDEPELSDKVINVDRASLLNFMQYRAKSFDPASFNKILDEMDSASRDALVNQYIEEEVLVREANKLGLQGNDYVIRQRLVQKMEFLSKGFIEISAEFNEQLITQFYEQNKQDYAQSTAFTFSHLFVNTNNEANKQKLNRLAQTLNSQNVSVNDAIRDLDAFLYQRNYAEKSERLISSHFGAEFTSQIKSFSPNSSTWQGPVSSEHGLHLVKLLKKEEAHIPALEAIYDQVERDARYAFNKKQLDLIIDELKSGYDVVISQATFVSASNETKNENG